LPTNETAFFIIVALTIGLTYVIHLLSKRFDITGSAKKQEQEQELLLMDISAKTNNLLLLLDEADRIDTNIRQLNKEFYHRFGY
jgi:hypothetical protein